METESNGAGPATPTSTEPTYGPSHITPSTRFASAWRQMDEQVREFHAKFQHPYPPYVRMPMDERQLEFRLRLIHEEYGEVADAVQDILTHIRTAALYSPTPVEHLAKELADLLYVTVGTAVAFGIPINDVFAEVHRSNMTKDQGNLTDAGTFKPVKGPGYSEANLKRILQEKNAW